MDAGAGPALVCPSAQPDWPNARVIGVADGSNTDRIGFLASPVDPRRVLPLLPPGFQAGQVLRIAADCAQGGCQHFGDGACHLVRRAVELLPEVVAELPACNVRRDCRWWAQEGAAACHRCPGVITVSAADGVIERVADQVTHHAGQVPQQPEASS